MKDTIYRFLSYRLPPKLVYWVIIRAVAYTSTHECSNKEPDNIGFSDLTKSWEKKPLFSAM